MQRTQSYTKILLALLLLALTTAAALWTSAFDGRTFRGNRARQGIRTARLEPSDADGAHTHDSVALMQHSGAPTSGDSASPPGTELVATPAALFPSIVLRCLDILAPRGSAPARAPDHGFLSGRAPPALPYLA
ncbi:MAG: hypothetical protein ACK5AZ_25180 [Bryobacteraceae bacterium]